MSHQCNKCKLSSPHGSGCPVPPQEGTVSDCPHFEARPATLSDHDQLFDSDVYDYQTGDPIGTADYKTYILYREEVHQLPSGQRDTGAVDGTRYGFPGKTIYMVEGVN